MDIKEIEQRVTTLNSGEGTQDLAGCLFRDVLEAIAAGAEDPRGMAAAALNVR